MSDLQYIYISSISCYCYFTINNYFPEYENKITLPDDIAYLGTPYTDEDIEVALC